MNGLSNQTVTVFLKRKTQMVLSEFDELICSLHVLVRPHHHTYRVAWAEEVRSALPACVFEEIQALGVLSHEWLGVLGLLDSFTHGRSRDDINTRQFAGISFAEGIGLLRALPDAEFLQMLFNGRYNLSEIILWMQHIDDRAIPKQLSEAERDAVQRPGRTRRRMIEALEAYYNLCFANEWAMIEPWLVRAARIFYEELQIDPFTALNTLHPRLRVKSDAIYAQKSELHRWAYEDLGSLVVRPSTFMEPHLLISINTNVLSLPLAVRVPGALKSEVAPLDLVRMYKSLSDGTRLKLVRSLVKHPYCTQQLAQIHGISEAAVSKHLKILVESRMVAAERRGNYVFYKFQPEEMEMMIVYLRDYLEH